MRAASMLRGVAVAAVVAMPATAAAQVTFPPITDRTFNIDLFAQPALGSPRLIAMSGAISAVAEGAAGLYTNPASAAIRPETRSDKLAWGVYDAIVPGTHGTAGVEVRVFAFRLGGHERRVSISAASDLAARYKNLALSIGFWN